VGYNAELSNSLESIAARAAAGRLPRRPLWAMLVARTVLFVACQGLLALGFALAGQADPWNASVPWWPVTATVANIVNLGLLVGLTRTEGIRLTALWNLHRTTWRRDSLLFVGAFVVLAPLTMFPSSLLALSLWGDVNVTTPIMFQPLPMWAVLPMLVLFPLSVALTELPTYFGYAMPRLQVVTGRRVAIAILASAALALQHVALPLVADWRFATWRLLMYAPFALFVGWALDRRPTLMPYFMTMHVVLDLSVPIYVLLASTGRL
jgi:hypothetical protein